MLKKYICLILSFTILFENSVLLAANSKTKTKTKIVQKYKDGVYKAFSPVKIFQNPKDKREYLKNILSKINKEFEKADTKKLSDKEMASFLKMKKQFNQWEYYLPQVKDEELDAFSEAMIQETEQAFVVALVVSIIVVVIIVAIIAVCCSRGVSGGLYVRGGAPIRRPLFAPRRRAGFGIHFHAPRRGMCRRGPMRWGRRR